MRIAAETGPGLEMPGRASGDPGSAASFATVLEGSGTARKKAARSRGGAKPVAVAVRADALPLPERPASLAQAVRRVALPLADTPPLLPGGGLEARHGEHDVRAGLRFDPLVAAASVQGETPGEAPVLREAAAQAAGMPPAAAEPAVLRPVGPADPATQADPARTPAERFEGLAIADDGPAARAAPAGLQAPGFARPKALQADLVAAPLVAAAPVLRPGAGQPPEASGVPFAKVLPTATLAATLATASLRKALVAGSPDGSNRLLRMAGAGAESLAPGERFGARLQEGLDVRPRLRENADGLRGFSLSVGETGSFRSETARGVETAPEQADAGASIGEGIQHMGDTPAFPSADVVISLSDDARLEVTLGSDSRESVARLEAESGHLEAALQALGTDVEAIRVELRPERAPDAWAGGSSAGAGGGGHAGAQGEWEGQAARDGHSHGYAPGLLPARGAAAASGKVDRYG